MSTVSKVSIKSLLVPSKDVAVEYPGMPGFVLNIRYLSRETVLALRKKATTTKFKNRSQVEEVVDDDLFLELYVESVLRGWTGLKQKYLGLLVPVDLEGQDPEAEIPFSKEDALVLMKSSSDLDSWISSQVNDLTNFQSAKSSK